MRVKKYKTEYSDEYPPQLVMESSHNYPEYSKLSNPDVVWRFCLDLGLGKATEEHVLVFALDNATHMIGYFELSVGTVGASVVSTREVFMKLLLMGAVSYMIIHNHPSDNTVPSDKDRNVKKKLAAAGKLMDISMLDFIIIGRTTYYSAAEEHELYISTKRR